MAIGINSISLEGENIQAAMAMQYASVNATVIGEGLALLEARVTLKTDDGAFIHAAWSGRAYLSEGLVAIAPTFRTANDSYTWLNRVQAVGAGEEDLAAGSFRLTVPITRIKLDSGSTRFAMFRSLLKERRPGSRVRVPRCFRLTLWCLFGAAEAYRNNHNPTDTGQRLEINY